ncbi:MAG TPA: glutamine--tRNA ligase [Cytophagales bacterium]|nr:glutamine--tRNA ligase [Cytophagales bacterium]
MSEEKKPTNFLQDIVEEDLKGGMPKKNLGFRFPPEPNGYLHIGHVKAMSISFGLGEQYQAPVNLRFDDTNPAKEEDEYVRAIQEDIQWLGFQWAEVRYSSDYFQQLYDWAVKMIKAGTAYVDSQSSEAMAEQKGTPTKPGVAGPYRDRSVEENLELFDKMKRGEFEEGKHVLRAKIDMEHTNMLMRDPIMYRVVNKAHHRTGTEWHIYPVYDWAHGQSDYLEGISHSLCSLEFMPHRELYDWFLDQIKDDEKPLPKQREFARLNIDYTVMSKRKLLALVESGTVAGWDDPRMPTISAMRRRGYPPQALRNFVERVGVTRRENVIELSLLEYFVREELNRTATRVMAVLDPVKVVITNYPEGETEYLSTENNPEDENAGTRELPFGRELYIERADFKEEANRKFFRLTLGKEVRLKSAYIIKGESVVKDTEGNITEIHVTYDPKSKSGSGTEESLRKVKGTLHWVAAEQAVSLEVRQYDRLFMDEAPDGHKDKEFTEFLNPDSLQLIQAYGEPSLKDRAVGERVQFQRLGYFVVDPDTDAEKTVYNKTVGLKDNWAKKTH